MVNLAKKFYRLLFEMCRRPLKQSTKNSEGGTDMAATKQEIFNKAMEEATKVFGVDPAYFGEEGTAEVERQLQKLGYSLAYLKEN